MNTADIIKAEAVEQFEKEYNEQMKKNGLAFAELLAAKDKEHKEVVEDLQCRLSNLNGAMAIQDKEIERLTNIIHVNSIIS